MTEGRAEDAAGATPEAADGPGRRIDTAGRL